MDYVFSRSQVLLGNTFLEALPRVTNKPQRRAFGSCVSKAEPSNEFKEKNAFVLFTKGGRGDL
jgi:hypothetical protein